MPDKIKVTGTEKGEYAIEAKYKRFAGVESTFHKVILNHAGNQTSVELDPQATFNLFKELDNAKEPHA